MPKEIEEEITKEEEETTTAPKDDLLLGALMDDYGVEFTPADLDKPSEEEEARKAEEEAAAAAKEEEEAAAKAAEEEAAAKKRQPTKVVKEEDTRVEDDNKPLEKPAPKEPAKPDPDAEFIATLEPELQEEIVEADVAARLFPDKYKEMGKKLTDWHRKLIETSERLEKEDPTRTFDEDDDEFQTFLKTKPTIQAGDMKKVLRTIGEEAAVQKMKGEIDPELDRIKAKQRATEVRPQIEEVVVKFNEGVINSLEDVEELKDVVAEFKEGKDLEEIGKDHKLESAVVQEEASNGAALVDEYLMWANRARVPADYDDSNVVQSTLFRLIQDQGKIFAEKGGKHRIREGKSFLSRADYIEATAQVGAEAVAEKHWTFGNHDIVNMIAAATKNAIASRIKQENERAERYGFTRASREDSAKGREIITEAKTKGTPKAAPRPGPGATGKPGKDAIPLHRQNIDVSTLYPK